MRLDAATMDAAARLPIDDLHRIIQEKQTTAVLWIVPQTLLSAVSTLPGSAGTANTVLQRPPARYDIGVAWHANTQLSREHADHLYACLRDQWCKATYLLENPNRLRYLSALGFSPLKHYPDSTLFHFDIYDYKQVPDWLNSRFWAHPEMWDKH